MQNNKLKIVGTEVLPGEEKQLQVAISKLPTRTEINIPIIVNRAKKPGPTVLIMGGMHGDEINGVEIVRRIIVQRHNKPTKGTIICIPILNIYGFLNFSRQVPDGKDVNRSFPGSKTGSLASQIAYHLSKDILPLIDVGLDFHTGGSRINNYPQVRGYFEHAENLKLAQVFGTKYIINSKLRRNSLRNEVKKMGKSMLIFEGGESLRLRKNVIDEGVNGALRVLQYLGMRDEAPAPRQQPILISKSRWIRSSSGGLYHSFVRPGEQIEVGTIVGKITGPFGEFEKSIKSTVKGHILSINNIPVVNKGDALMHIGINND